MADSGKRYQVKVSPQDSLKNLARRYGGRPDHGPVEIHVPERGGKVTVPGYWEGEPMKPE
jgi:hypothetical protein